MNVPTSKLKPNPSNPRILRDEKFLKLKASIESFPDMLNKRPIVAVTDTDGKYMVLGGNMRLRACQDLKLKEVPIILADEWTEEQRREFIIKDNVGYGEWDWDQLANEWDAVDLDAWGLDVPKVADFSTANEEVNVDALDGTMCIKLNYTEQEYWNVKNALATIAATPEQAVYQLLKL
jgi:ParB-like chromosome segregation protein Spo0J